MLPDKTIKLSYSLLGVGALLLQNMRPNDTVSSLWERVKRNEAINTYEKFITGLIVLKSLGVVSLESQILHKVTK